MIWNKFIGEKMVKASGAGKVIAYSSAGTEEGRLFVYLINKGEKPETVRLDIENIRSPSIDSAWEFFGQASGDMHPVWQAREQSRHSGTVDLKGLSINVFEINTRH